MITRETGQDEPAALAEAAGRFNTGVEAYLRMEAAVLGGADPQVCRMLEARRCWIRGTYDWSMHAARYG